MYPAFNDGAARKIVFIPCPIPSIFNLAREIRESQMKEDAGGRALSDNMNPWAQKLDAIGALLNAAAAKSDLMPE